MNQNLSEAQSRISVLEKEIGDLNDQLKTERQSFAKQRDDLQQHLDAFHGAIQKRAYETENLRRAYQDLQREMEEANRFHEIELLRLHDHFEAIIQAERKAGQSAEQHVAQVNAELQGAQEVIDELTVSLNSALAEQQRLEHALESERQARLTAKLRRVWSDIAVKPESRADMLHPSKWIDLPRKTLILPLAGVVLVITTLTFYSGWGRINASIQAFNDWLVITALAVDPGWGQSQPPNPTNTPTAASIPISIPATMAQPISILPTVSTSTPTSSATPTPTATLTHTPTITPTPSRTPTPTPFTFPTLVATCESLDGDAKKACREAFVGAVVVWQGRVADQGDDGRVSVDLSGTEWYRKVTLDFAKGVGEARLPKDEEIRFQGTIQEIKPSHAIPGVGVGLEVVVSNVTLLPLPPTATPTPLPTSTKTSTPTSTLTPTPTSTPTPTLTHSPTPTPPPTPFTYPTLVANFESLKDDTLVQYLLRLIGTKVTWQGTVIEKDSNKVRMDVGKNSWNRKVILNFEDSGGQSGLQKGDNIVFTATISQFGPGAYIFWRPSGIEVELTDITLLAVQRPAPDQQ